ncbi:flavodoxin [Bacillus sp. AFS055030]|uniref:flavodoxin n=1 Tax=Bacillus sp. AFS055030 TaxID=2033507 RepID=UPI000BFC1ACB|nr:flavodoxin [Bacillus sp. AFS055030]PGL73277.1 flavodoxin [Bacillus sp. AFS055030]
MAKILIAFASMSGNTEEIAELIKSSIDTMGHDIEMKEIEHINTQKLVEFDGIILGAYTWGDGELPYEVEDFYDDLENLNLTGKKAAVFGSGDHAYPKFCAAVDLLEERLKECGAQIIQEGLKVELAPETEEDIERCVTFAINYISQFEDQFEETV